MAFGPGSGDAWPAMQTEGTGLAQTQLSVRHHVVAAAWRGIISIVVDRNVRQASTCARPAVLDY